MGKGTRFSLVAVTLGGLLRFLLEAKNLDFLLPWAWSCHGCGQDWVEVPCGKKTGLSGLSARQILLGLAGTGLWAPAFGLKVSRGRPGD